jgi:putative ABC transport system permease protein
LFAKEFTLNENMGSFKQELLRHPNILSVALSTGIPSDVGWSNMPVWQGQQEDDRPFFYRMIVDYDFLELYEIPLESGRYFSEEMRSDNGNAYIINKAAAERMDFHTAVGSQFGFNDQLGTVVGLTEDFYFESLHKPITPIGIGVREDYYWQYVSIKILPSDISKTIDHIENTWKIYVPELPINFTFFDARLDQLYRKDRQVSRGMNYLSLMALLISSLGVFGLMSLSLRERTREIGIRKVLGATFARLCALLTREFLVLVAVASVLGGTLGWQLSREWLQNFAYRCRFGADIIMVSIALTLIISMGILSLKLVQSIHANPAEALRSE